MRTSKRTGVGDFVYFTVMFLLAGLFHVRQRAGRFRPCFAAYR